MDTVTDLKRDLNAYLDDLAESEVRSLADVIEYNIKHADVELPPGRRSRLPRSAHLSCLHSLQNTQARTCLSRRGTWTPPPRITSATYRT